MILIKNVNIITPYEVLKGYSVLIKDGIISDINPDKSFNHKEYRIVDGGDHYLSPGFIDIHNHGNSGFDIMDSTEQALDQIGKYHIRNGVTSYLGTVITSSYNDMLRATKNINNYLNKDNISQILGVHLEGPFFNLCKKGAQPEKYIKSPNIAKMKSMLDLPDNKIKMVSLAPELDGALEIISYLQEKNITVAMGHTNATFEEAKNAISHGATVATHLYNGMRSYDHREPGIVGAALNDNKVYCEIIYDRIHLHDNAVNIALKMKGSDKIILISDSIRAAGLGDGQYELGGQIVNVSDGIARLKSGFLAGSTLNLRNAVYNMIKFLNIPIHEVIKMASLNAAKAINVSDALGSIEIGKRADLIIFDKDIIIKKIILGGKVI